MVMSCKGHYILRLEVKAKTEATEDMKETG